MNIFRKALNKFNSTPDNKAVKRSTLSNPENWFADLFGAGDKIKVSERTALCLSAYFSGIQMISNNIASLDGEVIQREADGNVTKQLNHSNQGLIQFQPNPNLSSYKFHKVMVANLLVHGNAYALIERQGNKVKALYPKDPRNTSIYKNNDSGKQYYSFKNGGRKYPQRDVIHLYNFSLDGEKGLSYLEAGFRNQLESHLSVQQFNQKYFENSSFVGGVLKTDDSLGQDPTVVDEAKSEVRQEWNKIHSGSQNAGNVAILEGGWDFEAINMNARDSQLIERSEFTVHEVARILNIPLSMLGIKGANSYNSVESDSKLYTQNAVLPIIKIITEEYRSKLFTEQEKKSGFQINLDYSGLEKITTADKGDYVQKMVLNGVMSPNEARKYIGLDTKDHLDFNTIQKNVDIVDQDGSIRKRESE